MARKRMIDPNIWRDERFGTCSAKARLLYIYLFCHCNDQGHISLTDETINYIAQVLEMQRETIKNCLKELISKKMISIKDDQVTVLRQGDLWYTIRAHGYQALRDEVYERDNYTCRYCGSKENLTLDHVIPQSKGGEDSIDNLVTACKSCNSRKKDRTPEEAGMTLRELQKGSGNNGRTSDDQ